jgi:hypothetical protein
MEIPATIKLDMFMDNKHADVCVYVGDKKIGEIAFIFPRYDGFMYDLKHETKPYDNGDGEEYGKRGEHYKMPFATIEEAFADIIKGTNCDD